MNNDLNKELYLKSSCFFIAQKDEHLFLKSCNYRINYFSLETKSEKTIQYFIIHSYSGFILMLLTGLILID